MVQASTTVIASPDESIEAPSNFDRLHSHLNADSLALVLLDAWVACGDGDRARAMMEALEIFHNPKQVEDEQSATEET